jgi:hypothetical protein
VTSGRKSKKPAHKATEGTENTEEEMKDSNIINGNCWVTYFDILGFSKMVESFPVECILEKYKEALKKIKEYKVNRKFFSDSFIFYTENDSQDSFRDISMASGLFFQAMFLEKIPLRGCLNVGQFYRDEKNGIFFGLALIEAYELSEGQNWIGFVLSEKAREKSAVLRSDNDLWLEYDVPYNKKPKRRNLLVYYPNILIDESAPEPAKYQHERLLDALDIMEGTAQSIYQKEKGNNLVCCQKKHVEFREIITKYKNTRKFLLFAYPLLRKRFERKYLNAL